MQELPPMSDRQAIEEVKRVAARYEGGYTLVKCRCAGCSMGVRASRSPDGLCDSCRVAGCNPAPGYVGCHPGTLGEK